MQEMFRGLVAIDEGQVHFRAAVPDAPQGPPLLMFHASPWSSLSLARLAGIIGQSRVVIALDTLGQGDSCPPRGGEVDMTYVADAMYRAYRASEYAEARFDLFGTHTGARIGLEIALAHPDAAGRLILDGMGLGGGYYDEYARTVDLSAHIDQDGTQFLKAWQKLRDGHIFWPPYQRDAEHLRQKDLPSAEALHEEAMQVFKSIEAGHLAYLAALKYPAQERLPQLKVPTLVSCARRDSPYRFLDDVVALVPNATRAEHPADSAIGDATDDELAQLSAMFTSWLDQEAAQKTA